MENEKKPLLTKRVLIWLAVGVGLFLLSLPLLSRLDMPEVRAQVAQWHPVLVFALMALLPVGGFSVMAVYILAGVRFGGPLGLLLVALATVVHLLLTYWISHGFLRPVLLKKLSRHRLPEVPGGENAAVTLLTALVPGPPYFARNYLLALTGIPLKIYFWICLPVYVLRSSLSIFASDLANGMSVSKVGLLGGVLVIKLGICGYVLWRLRQHLKKKKAEEPQHQPQS